MVYIGGILPANWGTIFHRYHLFMGTSYGNQKQPLVSLGYSYLFKIISHWLLEEFGAPDSMGLFTYVPLETCDFFHPDFGSFPAHSDPQKHYICPCFQRNTLSKRNELLTHELMTLPKSWIDSHHTQKVPISKKKRSTSQQRNHLEASNQTMIMFTKYMK